MQERGYCQKDNIESPIEKGCRHPTDYCQFRNMCIIHFMEQERKSDNERGKGMIAPKAGQRNN